MPYKVEHKTIKSSKKDWAILKKENNSWHIVGRSTNEKDAKASVRARRASENEKK